MVLQSQWPQIKAEDHKPHDPFQILWAARLLSVTRASWLENKYISISTYNLALKVKSTMYNILSQCEINSPPKGEVKNKTNKQKKVFVPLKSWQSSCGCKKISASFSSMDYYPGGFRKEEQGA